MEEKLIVVECLLGSVLKKNAHYLLEISDGGSSLYS